MSMWSTVYSQKDIIKLSYDFVGVIAHGNTTHSEGDYIVSGKLRHMCSVYGLPSCKVHEEMRNELSRRGLLKGVRGTPTHIIYNPHDMTEISRSNYQSVSALEDFIHEAQKVLGKPITWREFSKLAVSLDEAETALGEKKFRDALKAIKDFDPKGMTGLELRFKDITRRITEGGEAKLEEGRKLLADGDPGKALKIFRHVSRDFRGTDLEEKAKELISEAKNAE